jgi:hypothetical protein
MRRPPFAERGGAVRGAVDLVTGSYPGFLFGLPVGRLLPVFHLHESNPTVLDARLQYLANNGYRTVTTDAIKRFVIDGLSSGPKTVALCFDDCWSTLWTVAAPLLRRYGMTAIAFAIPARVPDAPAPRATSETNPAAVLGDRSDTPFATWPELLALHASGLIDIQSHSYSHSAIFSGDEILGYVSPAFAERPLLSRPLASPGEPFRWLGPDDLGAPLYLERSRLSDGLRFIDDGAARDRCVAHVAESGGAAFFDRPSWRQELDGVATKAGRWESVRDQQKAVTEEIGRARAVLESRLGGRVPHACLPWGIGGTVAAAALRAAGCELAFSDRLPGRRAVAAGDDPHRLMRLHERFIFCLPGRGRRWFFTAGR